jgi:hypothetical protein
LKKSFIILFSLFFFLGGCVTNYHGYETGGSNYIAYDLNGYDYNAFKKGVKWHEKIKTVVGYYHENPDTVNQQLKKMRDAGQEKIAFVIWHGRLSPSAKNKKADSGAFLMSDSGNLFWQHEQNIINIMEEIKKLGFNEVQIRLAPMGPAQPLGWEKWNELFFQENWNLLVNIRKTVEKVLVDSNIKRWYDLHSEGGGQTRGKNPEYNRKIWDKYVSTFGSDDSYGVSVVPCKGRLSGMIDNLRAGKAGFNPSQYAIDIYGNPQSALEIVKNELQSRNEDHKPIIIQETFYNNAKQFHLLYNGAKTLGLKLKTIMQWPLKEGSKVTHYSVTYPEKYNNYIISK